MSLGLSLAFMLLAGAAAANEAQALGAPGSGAPGRIAGKILDKTNALTLPAAPVEVVGTDTVVYTDLDGRYSVELPAGRHTLKFGYSGYQDQVIEAIPVESGQTTAIDAVLNVQTLEFSEELVVTAEAAPQSFTQAAQLLERQKAPVITEALASDEMKKNADSDAAAAMQRVTGLSVVDNQYVYVRGLGERYSNTALNGAILPTTEPDKRVVPLDLFPTGLVESVKITKSYLPDKPAEFAGGLVDIEPINFPASPTFSFSISQGLNTQATFRDVSAYSGGGLDWLSFDDGTRSLPSQFPNTKLSPSGIFGGGFSRGELESLGESLPNVWTPRSGTGLQDSSLSVMAGNSWNRFGAVVSLTYGYKDRYQEEEQNFYKVGTGNTIAPQNDYDFRVSTNKVSLGGVANLANRFSGNHRLAFENFFTHSSKNETRSFEGFNNDIRTDIRNTRLHWIEEGVFSSKLSGEHFFPGLSNSRLDWAATYSHADRDEPDLREVLYEFNTALGEFVLADESQSGFRMFNNLNDDVLQGNLDWSLYLTQWSGLPMSVKFGPSLTFRTRDFTSRRFRFIPADVRGVDLSLGPEQLFTPANIGPVFELNEETRPTDAYDAEQTILAGYAMVDVALSSRLRLVGGARVESSEQIVDTFDLFNPSAGIIRSSLDNTDILPGVNLVLQVCDDMNLRAAYSHTVNRPEFRELAPFEFTDVVGGRAVAGNPRLKRALIRNADLRWEWFPGGGSGTEVVAVSAFFKDFENPIERVVEATAQLRTSFENAVGATNWGFEAELRKNLGPKTLVSFNYTFVDSEIELPETGARVQTSLVRPLAGQSKSLFNAFVEFTEPSRDLSFRVLGNFFDDRISDVGALGLPDIFEEGRVTLDAVVTKRFGPYSLRLAADNLLDSEIRFTQGGELQRLYTSGRTIGLSLSYSK